MQQSRETLQNGRVDVASKNGIFQTQDHYVA
jgi:hypothetical protein